MWSSLVWITSFGYQSLLSTNQANMLANHRNIIMDSIAMTFLFARHDIVNPRYCTREPCEHTFAGWRCERCKATGDETLMIEDKRRCKVNAIYKGNLAVSRDPRTGYQSMWSNFVQASTDTSSALVGGPANVSVNERPVVEVLWPFVKPIINSCSQKMKPLLQRLGVQDSELSPFVREFDLSTDLALLMRLLFLFHQQ
jgi:hypothetical protein